MEAHLLAPYDPSGLKNVAPSDARPAGLMAPYLGRRFTVEELYDEDKLLGEAVAKLSLVRAFEVPDLVGQTFSFCSATEVSGALAQLLIERLPGFAWVTDRDWSGPLHKYAIVHGSLAAPTDLATGQPMALELFAKLVEVDGKRLEGAVYEQWLSQRRQSLALDTPPRYEHTVAVVRAASYANVRYPGVGVPFYM